MRKTYLAHIILLGASGSMLASAAHAQADQEAAPPTPATPDTGAPFSGSEIVVTANKRAQNLNDVPMSITVVSGDQLRKLQINNVQDLTKLTPGLSYVESGSSVPVYSLRGVGFFDTSIGARPTVSVYVDEAPLPFSIMTTGAAFDLERVEVLKGPQGTLFGQNSTGGAINYIAAKPTKTFQGGVTGSFGTFDSLNLEGFVSGPLTDTLSVRLALKTQQSEGWQRSYTRDDTLGGKNMSQGRLLIDWKPTDRLKISINANGFVDRSDTQAGQLIAVVPSSPSKLGTIPLLSAYPLAPHNDRAADWDPDQDLSKHNDFYQVVGRADYQLTDHVALTSLTAYSHFKLDQLTDVDGTALNNARLHGRGNLGSFSEELRLAGNGRGLHWLVGASYAHDKSVQDDRVDLVYSTTASALLPFGTATANQQTGEQRFNTKAVFGNVDIDIMPHITAHGGVRYTKTDLDYSGCTRDADGLDTAAFTGFYNFFRAQLGLTPLSTIPANSCLSTDANFVPALGKGSFNQDNVSWRAGLDWKPSQGTLIYGNVSRGFKAGSAPIVSALQNSELLPVKQESVLAYEVGFKTDFIRHVLGASGAGFIYNYRDKQLLGRVITTPNVFGPLTALVNIPTSQIKGVELELWSRPTRELSLSVGGTYLHTEITAPYSNYTILGNLQNFQGSAFPYTPKWQIVGDAEYRLPVSDDKEVYVGGNVSYRSATSAGFGNEPLLRINPYTLLDLRAGFGPKDGRWQLGMYARNVTNAYYWTNVAKTFDVARRLTGMPRTLGVQASVKF